MRVSFLLCAFAVSLGAAAPAMAQNNYKSYKWIDEKGVVNYGPVPPAMDEAVKVDTSSALTLRNSSACPGRNCYDLASFSTEGARRYQERAENYQNALRARQEQIVATQAQRRNQLSAECARNRGTDCNNPAALRDIQYMNRPYGRRY